jgi:WD40 repeat protein
MAASVSALALSPQNLLAVGTEDGTVTLYNLSTADQQPIAAPIQTNNQSIHAIAWSPDGNSLVTGGDDKQATIWTIQEQYSNWQGGGPDHRHQWGG